MKHHLTRVGEICSLINGRAFKPEDWSEQGTPIIRIQNLNNRSRGYNYWAGPLDRQIPIAKGDVLLAWSGTPGTSFGAHIWDGPAGILNQHIFRVDLDEKRVSKNWFMRAVNSRLNLLIAQAHGGVGLKHVTRRMVDDLELPLPPLNEQQRIAAILDQADDLRSKRRLALQRIEKISSALFEQMFIQGHKFEVRSLGELCSVIRDGTHKTPKYIEVGVPFVTVKNITSGTLDLSDTKYVSESEHRELTRRVAPARGDILVSKDGTIGVPCPIVTDEVFSIFVSVALLRPRQDLIDQAFLTAQIKTDSVQKQIKERSKGIAIRHLHLEDFRELRIATPDLNHQQAFAVRVAEIDVLKVQHRAHLAKLDALFASLQHRAFWGEL